jgi:hypothetical protein
MRNLSVKIDHLVLDGVLGEIEGDHCTLSVELMEAALRCLLEEQGSTATLAEAEVAEITASTTNLPAHASDKRIAEELARALVRTLGNRR